MVFMVMNDFWNMGQITIFIMPTQKCGGGENFDFIFSIIISIFFFHEEKLFQTRCTSKKSVHPSVKFFFNYFLFFILFIFYKLITLVIKIIIN